MRKNSKTVHLPLGPGLPCQWHLAGDSTRILKIYLIRQVGSVPTCLIKKFQTVCDDRAAARGDCSKQLISSEAVSTFFQIPWINNNMILQRSRLISLGMENPVYEEYTQQEMWDGRQYDFLKFCDDEHAGDEICDVNRGTSRGSSNELYLFPKHRYSRTRN